MTKKEYKDLLAKTWYTGFYYDIRDGIRYAVTWRHQFTIQGKLINEEEVEAVEQPLREKPY